MLALGIDIGGSSVKAVALNAGGEWRAARSAPYANPSGVVLRAAIADTVARLGPLPTADAIGLCLPGVFDAASGAVAVSMNVPGLVGLPIREEIGRAVASGAPIRIFTDAHAAAFDWLTPPPRGRGQGGGFAGSASDADPVFQAIQGRLLALSLGTGVGACVLDESRPLRVSGESPGHLGQLDVTLPEDAGNPPIGADGGAGSLEAYIGAPALRRRFGQGPFPGDFVLRPDDPALRALAKAIRIAHAIYRPRHVVLLGGVGIRLRGSIPALRALVEDRLTSLARPGWTLDAGDDEFHAARGAARLAVA